MQINQPLPSLSQSIKAYRQKYKLTQQELANRLKLDKSYLSKMENEKCDYPPAERLLEEMAALMEMDAEVLILSAGRIPKRCEVTLQRLAVKYGKGLDRVLQELL